MRRSFSYSREKRKIQIRPNYLTAEVPLQCHNLRAQTTGEYLKSTVDKRVAVALRHDAGQAAEFHGSEAIIGAEFPQHPVDVIFHRLLGKIELARDFLIRQSAADHVHELLLSTRETKIMFYEQVRGLGALLGNLLEQSKAKRWRTYGFTAGY